MKKASNNFLKLTLTVHLCILDIQRPPEVSVFLKSMFWGGPISQEGWIVIDIHSKPDLPGHIVY